MRSVALSVYKLLDRLLVRLHPRNELRVKRTLLGVARLLAPHWVKPGRRAEHLLAAPPPPRRPIPLPHAIRAHMEDVGNVVDPAVHPARYPLRSVRIEKSTQYGGDGWDVFRTLQALYPPAARVAVLVSAVRAGGAEKAAMAHAAAYAARGLPVVVIATDEPPSRYAPVPNGVTIIDASSQFAMLRGDHGLQRMVLARLIVQEKPALIHVVQSRLAWEMMRHHGAAIASTSRCVASLYCDELDETGLPFGYAEEYLQDCIQHLDLLVTDNRASPDLWHARLGVPASRFSVAPVPVAGAAAPCAARPAAAPPHVAWAGRLVRQKRPDLLLALARLQPTVQFDMHGEGPLGADLRKNLPRNVRMNGAFSAFAQIRGDVFVHTSQWDGLPNVVLEAAAAGIPVIAFDVGGLGDFLHASQLAPFGDVDALALLLTRMLSDDAFRDATVRRQHERIGSYSAAALEQWSCVALRELGVQH